MTTRFDRFDFVRSDALPRLAWCATIQQNRSEVSVRHGPWVETAPRHFFEGAWAGEARAARFDQARTFCGSGARLENGDVVFATSTHTLEPVHLLRLPRAVLCSNSIHFLLAEARDAISTGYLHYDADIMTIMFGTDAYTPSVPTANGHAAEQLYHCNFSISPDLEIRRHAKPPPPGFADFQAYADFVFGEAAGVTRNASDPARRVRYEPLATVSTGYDSPACAVIARAAGCRRALTFTKARSNFADRDDSGKRIGDILQLDVVEYAPLARGSRTDFPEAEFIATGHGGDDVVMASAEGLLPAKLLYTGYHGDKVWDRHNKKVGTQMVRGDTSGCSLAEFRLRTGFINLPVPFIGCANHPDIHRISNATEMRPWSLDNSYDRPIPRRIVEQAGVPRHLFGQSKKAITTPYQSNAGANPPMQEILCRHSYLDFLKYAKPVTRYETISYRCFYSLMHYLYVANLRAVQSGKLRRALGAVRLKGPARVVVPWRYSKPRTNNSLAFHWAADKLRQRYTPAPQKHVP